jgi:Zn-finger protein
VNAGCEQPWHHREQNCIQSWCPTYFTLQKKPCVKRTYSARDYCKLITGCCQRENSRNPILREVEPRFALVHSSNLF